MVVRTSAHRRSGGAMPPRNRLERRSLLGGAMVPDGKKKEPGDDCQAPARWWRSG
jgi:hypothetical protein